MGGDDQNDVDDVDQNDGCDQNDVAHDVLHEYFQDVAHDEHEYFHDTNVVASKCQMDSRLEL